MKAFKSILFFLFLFVSLVSSAQNQAPEVKLNPGDTLDLYSMTLEQLMQLKASGVPSEMEKIINQLIGVASKKALTSRDSPSIISLITHEEIVHSGARDLIDVLRLVPGFDFGVDVQGVVGIGIRGNWAYEGKTLILLDGAEMNEILYSTFQLGNHIGVDQIKKIEIIRGPGSAIYGGYAEYGVINIITQDGEDLKGVSVNGIYSQMSGTYGQRNVGVSIGDKIKDLNYSISFFTGQGTRSNQNYMDFSGQSYNMTSNSKLDPTTFNLGLTYKGLVVRGIYDLYQTTNKDEFGSVSAKAYQNDFKSSYFD